MQLGEENKAMAHLKKAVSLDKNLFEVARGDMSLKKLTATEEFNSLSPKMKKVKR